MSYDEVIPLLGGFGRYQKRIYFLLCLPTILCSVHKLSNVFIQAKPNYRCQLPSELPNASYNLPATILNESFPYDHLNQKYSSCSYLKNGTKIYCDAYIYDYSKYQSSVVIEWSIVCDRAYLTAIGDAFLMLGVLLGAIILGNLSDRTGRKKIYFYSLIFQVILGLLVAVAPEFWSYSIFRLGVGATTSGVILVSYVIVIEMVGPKDRMLAGMICQMFSAFGYIIIALFAYYISRWRYLQIALTIPGVLFFSYWWFIPESARWLLTQNRLEEVKLLIYKAAKENNVKVSDGNLHSLLIRDINIEKTKEKKVTVWEICRHRNLRKRALIIFFAWMVNSMTYYGLAWNTSNLGGNDYVNFAISGAAEIPVYIFLFLTLNRWGRKLILCSCMVTAGVALLLTMAVSNDDHAVLPRWLGRNEASTSTMQ